MIVCMCKAVSEVQAEAAVALSPKDVEALSQLLDGAGTACGACRATLQAMLDQRQGPRDTTGVGVPMARREPEARRRQARR
ncbi:MAG: (2Fe-2S)-binding protein [Deltaproteobacteria bacterium]|nr:(2Fe-2S)-binding protein [Deltaproteobacteria bacterium]